MTDGSGPAVFRTPDERFEGLPEFDFQPHYREVEGVRLAYLEEGEGPPIVMLHGAPGWSFAWRKVIPPLVEAGYRCIAPDHLGCGRSDKPGDPSQYTIEHHVGITRSLLDDLDLEDVTLVLHDWGGPIGLTTLAMERDRVGRAIVLDTALDPKEAWMSEQWVRFRDFVEANEDLPAGVLMQMTCVSELSPEVVAAYDAPFLGPASKIALRALPLSIERTEETPEPVARLLKALSEDERPIRIIWGERDMVLTQVTAERLAASIGRQVDEWIPNAGHGVQEDQGPLLAERIIAWLRELP